MLRLIQSFLFVLCVLTFFGCKQQRNDAALIDNLTNRFPQLKISSKTQKFNLIRSVSFSQPTITVKLYLQTDATDDKQQIILVTNAELDSYAIPFFSNTQKDYWNFKFDNIPQNEKSINTTFENELNVCLNTLHLNDTLGTAEKVINEILFSLLHCKDIAISDSSNFAIIRMNNKNSIPEEDSDSCYARQKRNWDFISQELYPNKNITYKHSCWDEDNGRVYQFDFKNFKRKQKNYFKLSVFRQDCNWHLLTE